MKIQIINLQNNKRVRKKEISDLAEKVLSFYNATQYSCTIILVDNAYMQTVNKNYLSKNRPTDVIAFGMLEGSQVHGDEKFLGDVFVSVEQAMLMASTYQNTVIKELRMYVIHGVLHLLEGQRIINADHDRLLELQEELYVHIYSKKKTSKGVK